MYECGAHNKCSASDKAHENDLASLMSY